MSWFDLIRVVRSHLRTNGDWNVNDWRDVAGRLANDCERAKARVRELEEARDQAVERDRSCWEHWPIPSDGCGLCSDRAALSASEEV